jgi:hypothetical protein
MQQVVFAVFGSLEISQPDEEKISGAAQVAFCRGRNSKAAHQRWGIAST